MKKHIALLAMTFSISNIQEALSRSQPTLQESSTSNRPQIEGRIENDWSAPDWGFATPKSLSSSPDATTSLENEVSSKSLVFDQTFDSRKLRPFPKIKLPNVAMAATPAQKTPSAQEVIEMAIASEASTTHVASTPKMVQENSSKAPGKSKTKPPMFTVSKGKASRVLVIDEDSLERGDPQPVPGAKIYWLSRESGFVRKTNSKGLSKAPYPNTLSARFVVEAPGYLTAVGYLTANVTTPVVLMKESRVGPILKSLNIAPDTSRILVLGKALRSNLEPASGITVDASLEAPDKVYYSIGSFGLYHPGAKETGSQGDFLISGLKRDIQYLMPTEKNREWPAWVMDMSALPEVVTTTVVDVPKPTVAETEIVDAMTLERPTSGVHVTVGGQRGLFIPDEDGYLKLTNLYSRGSPDLLEVSAQGYIKSWVNTSASTQVFPGLISLFSRAQLEFVFKGAERAPDFNQGLIFGNLRPEHYRSPVTIRAFKSDGRRSHAAWVYYFDGDNSISSSLDRTDRLVQNFAIGNLEPGEWHIVVTDPETGKGLAIQAVKVGHEVISQVQF